jgi:hypothetical protein
MATEIGELFRGVVYRISTCTDGGDLIRLLLERNGATEGSTPKVATRIITAWCTCSFNNGGRQCKSLS